MLDKLWELLRNVLLISVIAVPVGGVFLYVTGLVFGSVYTAVGMQTLLGALFALIVLSIIVIYSDIEGMKITELVLAVLGIIFVSEIVLMIAPTLSPYLLTGSAFSWTALGWFLAALGISFEVKEYLLG